MPLSRARTFLTAQWRYLVMVNYRMPPELLRPYVPGGTELDLFEGSPYASIVAFLFKDTKVLNVPIPFHQQFEEVNLRFYVQRREYGEVRRGAVFVQELVPKLAVAAVARAVYHENYSYARIAHQIDHNQAHVDVRFGWRFRSVNHQLQVTAAATPQPMVTGSEEQFIADHYWGYSRQPNGDTVEYQVVHEPWRIWQAQSFSLNVNVSTLYGERLGRALGEPSSVFIAEGSSIAVSKGRRIRCVAAGLEEDPDQ